VCPVRRQIVKEYSIPTIAGWPLDGVLAASYEDSREYSLYYFDWYRRGWRRYFGFSSAQGKLSKGKSPL